MTEPYLILHKVRGEPAFDIAIKLIADKTFLPDEDEIWIIPTSGHRAYPYRTWELSELIFVGDINAYGGHDVPYEKNDLPKDWPDHYSCNDRRQVRDGYEVQAAAVSLLEGLGLIKKIPVERREG